MFRLLLLAAVMCFAAGCEQKESPPTQNRGKVDTIKTTEVPK
jgi:hypothetical protein